EHMQYIVAAGAQLLPQALDTRDVEAPAKVEIEDAQAGRRQRLAAFGRAGAHDGHIEAGTVQADERCDGRSIRIFRYAQCLDRHRRSNARVPSLERSTSSYRLRYRSHIVAAVKRLPRR